MDVKQKFMMPCIWESDDLPDGATVELNTFHWTFVHVPGGDWSKPIQHSKEAPAPTDAFIVIRVNSKGGSSFTCPRPKTLWENLENILTLRSEGASGHGNGRTEDMYLALKAPNGKLLAAHEDATVTASMELPEGDLPLECVFKVSKLDHNGFTIWSVKNNHYLRAWDNGTLRLHMKEPTSWEKFHIRQVKMVPKFLGPNLGGWLVTESWMCPKELYDGVTKDINDGTKFCLRSYSEGKWVSSEGGGGDQLNANRDSPSGWEQFFFRRASSGRMFLRAGSGHYWRPDNSSGEVLANTLEGGPREEFGVRRKMGDENTLQFRASNGKWLRATPGGRLYADVEEDAPGWNTECTFTLQVISNMGGEYQLDQGLGAEEAKKRLEQHRQTWITEEDFKWLSEMGVTAIRVPVGYWMAQEPNPEPPFIEGSLKYLDKTFEWAVKYNLRVVLCLHAAKGSQNGWEHSASRDGIPMWGREDQPFVKETLEHVDFFLYRYGGQPAFAGFEALNEPTTTGVSFPVLSQYYIDCYHMLRKYAPAAYFIIMGRIFGSDKEWDNFMTGPDYTNVIFDTHWYQVHDTNTFGDKSVQFNLDYPTIQRATQLRQLEIGRRLVFVGEWSCALNCHCDDNIYKKFGKAQVDRYASSSGGFFFWNYKHGQGWRAWSFRNCIEEKWLDPEWWGGPELKKLQSVAPGGDHSEL